MKQFLYLDTDIVNSIIAQNEKGLVQSFSSENDEGQSKDKSRNGSVSIDGKVGGTLFKIANAEANLSSSFGFESSNNIYSASKELVSKTLHDATFDIAYEYMHPIMCNDSQSRVDEYGSYVEFTRVFDFVDINFLGNLFSKNGFIEFIKKTEKEKFEKLDNEMKENLSRDDYRKQQSEIKYKIKELINENDKKYDEIYDIISAFKQLLPYDRMLISHDGYLVPLDDKYFRISPESLGFKYGGEITCVGMVTNIIGKDTDPCDDNNIFATLQFSVNEALRTILPTNEENLCVIHPIAVFYNH